MVSDMTTCSSSMGQRTMLSFHVQNLMITMHQLLCSFLYEIGVNSIVFEQQIMSFISSFARLYSFSSDSLLFCQDHESHEHFPKENGLARPAPVIFQRFLLLVAIQID